VPACLCQGTTSVVPFRIVKDPEPTLVGGRCRRLKPVPMHERPAIGTTEVVP
jgi:hypothetical protein